MRPDEDYVDETPYKISNLRSIGLGDPFPDANTNLLSNRDKLLLAHSADLKITDLVYPDSRYHPDRSPSMIYMPSRSVIIKLIRACLCVKDEEDLWFNKSSPLKISMQRQSDLSISITN